MSSTDEKMIVLKSSDGETFEVKENIAMSSQTLKYTIEDIGTSDAIPVPMVAGKILGKVIEYLNRHAGSGEDLKAFDDEFVKVNQDTLFDLIIAANYLEIKSLLELTCQTIADMIKGKTPEQIRTIFNIKNDFTPEEEEQIRRENAWAFE